MKTNIFSCLAMVVLFFSACNQSQSQSQPDPEPLKLELLGTWRSQVRNSELIFTNNRTILSFVSSTKFLMSLSCYIPEFQEFTWRNKAMVDYSFDGVNLVISAADPGTKYICRAYPIDANSMTVYYDTFVNKKGLKTPMADTVIFRRVSDNLGYEELIIGMWEGVTHTGEETYGDEHHRWEYKELDRSGVYGYVYYNYNDLTSQWEPAAQSISEYNVHGSWLATRWQPQGGDLDHEWWDIEEITDTEMRWSAWRLSEKTGEPFLATFTFRRVVDE